MRLVNHALHFPRTLLRDISVQLRKTQTYFGKTKFSSNFPLKFSVFVIFVSPELSSGRNLVIQMLVRRAASAVHGFLSGAYLGNRMTYLDDIYVGGSRSKVAHAEFWAWQMPIKYLICIMQNFVRSISREPYAPPG